MNAPSFFSYLAEEEEACFTSEILFSCGLWYLLPFFNISVAKVVAENLLLEREIGEGAPPQETGEGA